MLLQDWEMPQTYQSILWAAFYSTESFERVPKMGETIHIPAPDVDFTKEGGVGFHELQELLQASDRVNDEFEKPVSDIMQRVIESGDPKNSKSQPRMLDVKVERACTYIKLLHDILSDVSILVNETIFYPNIQVPLYSHKKRIALGNALLDWCGFAPIKPMFGSQSPYNSDQEDVSVDNEGMRKVLNMAAQLTSRPDPSFETAEVPEVTKVEKKRDAEKEREREHVQPAPVRIHSRSWSLPPPPPDLQRTTKRVQTGRPANATKPPTGATATARQQAILAKAQQQILAKAKQAKPPALNKSKSKGDTQSQTTSKEEKKPEPAAFKERVWDVVKKWF